MRPELRPLVFNVAVLNTLNLGGSCNSCANALTMCICFGRCVRGVSQLATIIDERDDLLNRVRFLERQLVKSREERARNVVIDHVGSQTEVSQDRVLPPCGALQFHLG
jgi:hypothetical protein